MLRPTDTKEGRLDLTSLAARAVVEPVVVLAEIEQLRAPPGRRLSAADESMVQRAEALAERALDHSVAASVAARRAVSSARRAALAPREAEARLTLSLCLFESGRTAAALAELARAEALAVGPTLAQVAGQRGIFLDRLGRFADSVAAHTAVLDAASDELDRMRALNNRAIAHAFLGHFDAAQADLLQAIALANETGAVAIAARVGHNVGFVHALAGELPEALRQFDEADSAFSALGLSLGQNHVARARALLVARRHDDARDALEAAVAALEVDGRWADAVDAMVLLARVTLVVGNVDDALGLGSRAASAARRQQRPVQAAMADAVVMMARLSTGRWTKARGRQVAEAADRLAAAGLVGDADELRLAAAMVARRARDRDGATQLLDQVRAGRTRGTAVDRARAWYAEALRRTDGGGRGVLDAARRGLACVRQLQDTAGATELRVGLAGHGEALASIGLEQLVGRGDGRATLAWLQQWRGTARRPSSSAGRDGELQRDDELSASLAELRVARIRLDRAAESGDDVHLARRNVVDLERAIRARSLHRSGPTSASSPTVTSHPHDDRGEAEPLVAYFECTGSVGAVVSEAGRVRMVHPLARSGELDELIDHARFGLRRLVRPGGSPAAVTAAAEATRHALARLDALLVAPLRLTGAGPLGISPPPSLAALAWSALPSLIERPLTVLPSIAMAHAGRAVPPQRAGRVVLAAGPGLPGALTELDDLRRVHGRAEVFGSEVAFVDDVLTAMEGADLAHLACHGRSRTDNPMLSELAFADGPLTVYDIEKLRVAPAVVILAACDVGAATAGGGEELLGLVSALLAAGARAVMASLVPVPDHAVVPFMVAVHRALAVSVPLAEAAAAARRGLDPDSSIDLAIAAAFSCFG